MSGTNNFKLSGRLILGPMAGVTDLPFRLLCHEQGAALTGMEMISAKAVLYNNKNTGELMRIDERERPVSLQLFGSDPKIIAQIAAQIEPEPFDYLDINMGCPVPKIVSNGDGSALLKDPGLIREIVSETVHAINKPVTVKIRIGFDQEHINAVEVARAIEEAGAAAVAVHGRTREQYYSGHANWDMIRQVKEAVSIPVIGNGDVTSPQTARAMLDETGCDYLMIARAARGNPWIFAQINRYLEDGMLIGKPSRGEVAQMILRHTRMQIECKGAYLGIRQMRKHIAWYTAGMPHATRMRCEINEVETYEQVEEVLRKYQVV